jgi:hypothetical protein
MRIIDPLRRLRAFNIASQADARHHCCKKRIIQTSWWAHSKTILYFDFRNLSNETERRWTEVDSYMKQKTCCFRTKVATAIVAALMIGSHSYAGVPIPPIVMEEATVQAKIIILENFEEDRQAAAGLLVEIWSAEEDKTLAKKRKSQKPSGLNLSKKELVIETETDEDGFFYIEEGFELKPGPYIMAIGQVNIILIVNKLSADRAALNASERSKTLLILLPKEVFTG